MAQRDPGSTPERANFGKTFFNFDYDGQMEYIGIKALRFKSWTGP